MVIVLPTARLNELLGLQIKRPPLIVRSPRALKVLLSKVTLPVVLTVIVPVPVWKVAPPVVVPILMLPAPAEAVPTVIVEAPLCVSVDPESLMLRVLVPLPEVPMLIAPEPLETAPPELTFIVLPPLMLSAPVVVNVEPAPVTAIVEAVLFANAPVMIAS